MLIKYMYKNQFVIIYKLNLIDFVLCYVSILKIMSSCFQTIKRIFWKFKLKKEKYNRIKIL